MALKKMLVRFAILFFCVASVSDAQTSISGTVKNPGGGVLANATVTLRVANRTMKTGTDGKFTFTGLNPVTHTTMNDRAVQSSSIEAIGSTLFFNAATSTEPLAISLYTPSGISVACYSQKAIPAGRYSFEPGAPNCAAGLYIARVRIGDKTNAFMLPIMGKHAVSAMRLTKIGPASSAAAMAKSNISIIDTITAELEGFSKTSTPISQYFGDYTIVLTGKPAPVNTKIYSERGMVQIDWGKTTVEVWDHSGSRFGTQLDGSYPDAFEGANGWKVACPEGWSAWVFKSTNLNNVDMSAFAGGSLHLAIKGSAPSVGVFVSSQDSASTTLPLDSLGYAADGAWHEITIPLSKFVSLDLSHVSIYAGFSAPAKANADYAAGLSYIIDDLYFMPK
jgi:hypothetical protein